MKHYKFLLISFVFLTGCCVDEITRYYEFSEFEKSLVPYKSFQNLNFIDEEGITFIAVSEPLTSMFELKRNHPERCDFTEYETITSSLNFESKNLVIDISLEAEYSSFINFQIKSNGFSHLYSGCSINGQTPIQEHFEDLTIHGFEYQNVLVFENCSNDDTITKIIYSTTNGIEFIKFDSGKWWRLNISL